MIRTAGAVALAACALLVLLPTGAGAHRWNAPTTAEIVSGGPEGAQGTVSSPKRSCKKGRLVELFRVDDLGGEDQSFGTDTTDASGNWEVAASLFAGDYYVTVEKATKKKNKKHKHRCKKGKSAKKRL